MLLLSGFLLLSSLIAAFSTPLDDYVWRDDGAYGWVELPEHRISGKFGDRSWIGYTLNMTSQRWLTDADFAPHSDSKSLWWHYLVIIVPDEVKYTQNGTLWITGGSQTDGPPSADMEDIVTAAALSMSTGVITGSLFQIPNQHVIFATDPIQKSRSEDAVIAFSWDHFLNDPSQPDWLVRFPMVKASVKAMDAMKEFCQKSLPELNTSLDYFGVSGASKRGWTTWLVGAVDPKRVVLIIPIVLDAINFVAVEHHEYKSYGAWSWALIDYAEMNITSRMDDPNMILLQQNEDPYFYKERLTMPKLVVNAVLDEFQQPDDTHYWWNEMPDPKHFIMTPNAEHSEISGIAEIVPAIIGWYNHHLTKTVVPEFTWKISNTTGEIVATLNEHGIVHEANVWWAYSCGASNGVLRRDFRIATADDKEACLASKCGIPYEGYCANLKSFWNKSPLEESTVRGRRTYTAKLDAPTDGRYVAYMIEITYKKPKTPSLALGPIPPIPHDLTGKLVFTTEVSVYPDVFPFADCNGGACGNGLI